MALKPAERDAISDLIGSDVFRRLQNKPGLLKQSIELFTEGQSAGASTPMIQDSVRRFAANPTSATLDKQRKVLVCDGLDLPAAALDSDLDAKGLVDLGAGIASGGGDFHAVMNDPNTWKTIAEKGKRAGTDEVLKGVVGKSLGVPPSAMSRLTLEQVLKGAEFAQFRGIDGAIGKPGFWEDYGKGTPPNDLQGKWRGVLDAEEKAEQAKNDRELRETMREIQARLAQREAEAERLRQQRREDRAREEAAERKRARRKRRRRRKKRVKGRVTIGTPEIVRVIDRKSIPFSDGTRWDITWYSSGTESIKITQPDGSAYFWKGRFELEQITDNPHTPFVRRVRRTMQEWRRPAQSSQQAGGPLGQEG